MKEQPYIGHYAQRDEKAVWRRCPQNTLDVEQVLPCPDEAEKELEARPVDEEACQGRGRVHRHGEAHGPVRREERAAREVV